MNSVSVEKFASRIADDIGQAIRSEVFHVARESLKDAIATTVYANKKKMYMNTNQFLEAVEVSDMRQSRGKVEFEVRINTGRLQVVSDRPDWNAHGDMKGNKFDGIVEVLDQGTQSFNPFYMHEGYHFFDKAQNDLADGTLVQAMIRGLENQGYEVTTI